MHAKCWERITVEIYFKGWWWLLTRRTTGRQQAAFIKQSWCPCIVRMPEDEPAHWAEQLCRDHTIENHPLQLGTRRPDQLAVAELIPLQYSFLHIRKPEHIALESILELQVIPQLQVIMLNSRWGTWVLWARTELSWFFPWPLAWLVKPSFNYTGHLPSEETSLSGWHSTENDPLWFHFVCPKPDTDVGHLAASEKVPWRSLGRRGKTAASSGQPWFPLTQRVKPSLHWICRGNAIPMAAPYQ